MISKDKLIEYLEEEIEYRQCSEYDVEIDERHILEFILNKTEHGDFDKDVVAILDTEEKQVNDIKRINRRGDMIAYDDRIIGGLRDLDKVFVDKLNELIDKVNKLSKEDKQ